MHRREGSDVRVLLLSCSAPAKEIGLMSSGRTKVCHQDEGYSVARIGFLMSAWLFAFVVLDSSCSVARAVYFRFRRRRKSLGSPAGGWWSRGGSNS